VEVLHGETDLVTVHHKSHMDYIQIKPGW